MLHSNRIVLHNIHILSAAQQVEHRLSKLLRNASQPNPYFQTSWVICRFPATFTFVLRAFSTLEGIGRALDKDYKFVAVAQPYAQQLLNLQVWHCALQPFWLYCNLPS